MSLPLRTVFTSSVCTPAPKQMAQTMGDGRVITSSLDRRVLETRARSPRTGNDTHHGAGLLGGAVAPGPAHCPVCRRGLGLAILFCFHSLSGEDEPNNELFQLPGSNIWNRSPRIWFHCRSKLPLWLLWRS